VYRRALAIHAARYREQGIHSRYLFYDPAAYERAQAFFRRLALEVGTETIAESVQLRLVDAKAPGYTYFCGKKRKRPSCIIYPAATFNEGRPEAVLYVENSPSLGGTLRRHFDEQWSRAGRDFGTLDPAASDTRFTRKRRRALAKRLGAPVVSGQAER
jgi:hypothetical protein